MPKQIIVTADDLGIDPEINKGIIETFQKGILSSTALLMNAPYTNEGIKLAKENPEMETGIHLSIVEGISLRKVKSTITDPIPYFNDICLTRNWKEFLKKYIGGKINFIELEEELELQIIEFLKHFSEIPFLNGTQHMHIMPRVWKIIMKLSKKYEIKAIRVPSLERPNNLWLTPRFPFLIPFQLLGEVAKNSAIKSKIKTPDGVIGLQFSGKISEDVFLKILNVIPNNKSVEIVMHPGYESINLRNELPWAYSVFDWEMELKTLLSANIKKYIENNHINIIKFKDLT
ncbi:MAG: ChbG/HpnK family deacetylase [Bacteroidales bacterium]|nr:ChbG/HpnK family deacetylase [Bacteroidales bacterium]